MISIFNSFLSLTRSSDKSIVIINFGRSFFFFIETNEELELKSEKKFTSSSIVDEIDNEMNELLNEFKNEQKSHTVLDKAVNETEDISIEGASKGSIDYDLYLDDLFK